MKSCNGATCRRKRWAGIIAVVLSLGGATLDSVTAQPIYTGTSVTGSVVYSSRPQQGAHAKKALPEIMRTGRPAVKVKRALHCGEHGGLNCEAGPDADGSVICRDGYRATTAMYRWSCPLAKLVIVSLDQPEDSLTASVVVRNKGRLTAKNPKIFIKSLKNRQLDVKGPETLGVQGIAEYEIYIPPQSLPGGSRTVLWNNLWITCDVCG